MIEIIPEGVGLTVLDQRFRRAAAEGGDRLGAIPGHRLRRAARPIGDAGDDLQHFLQPMLGFGRLRPRELV